MAATDTTSNSGAPLTQALARLSGSQKIGLMVALAALIAIVVGSVMWGQTPEYRVLYSNLSDRDGGAIIESLQQMNVPYKFTEGGGAVLVPANQVHEARLKLASQGLPKGGNVGFELMENQKFGTSQFLEQVNYQRALEGELARSVQTLASVQSARVHLAIPKPTVFVKDQQKPSASVVLSLHPGRVLDAGQVSAIVHLISSSVPEMSAKSVTLVDQNGTLLSAMREGGTEVLDASQLKYLRQIEQDYVKRIQDIIIPLVGANNVRAQVTADLDFSQSEQTAESYGPNQPPNQAAVRSQQSAESVNTSGGPSGVPGALSNQPPVPATAPIVTPASAVAGSSATNSSHKEATTNFEVDRTIRHTKLPVGAIKHISVAVVVNHRTVLDKKGNPSTKPLSDEEKAQITALVKEAMGYNEKRGDSLEVINSPFTDDKEVVPETPLWKQPGMVDLGKEVLKYLLIAGVMLALIFMVIRPAFKNLAPPPHEPAEGETADEDAAGESVTGGVHHGQAGEAGSTTEAGFSRASPSYENQIQAVKQLAQQDPKIVATVVKEWVNGNE